MLRSAGWRVPRIVPRARTARGDDDQRVALARQQHDRASVGVHDLQGRAEQAIEHRIELALVRKRDAHVGQRLQHGALVGHRQHARSRAVRMGCQFLQHQTCHNHRQARRRTNRPRRVPVEVNSAGGSQMAQNLLDCHPSLGWVGNGRRPPRRFQPGRGFCTPVRAVVGVLLLVGLLLGGVQSAASAPDAQDRVRRPARCAWTCAPASTAPAESAAGCRSTSSWSTRAASSKRRSRSSSTSPAAAARTASCRRPSRCPSSCRG